MATPTPHDALFKQVFSQPDHAAGVLRTVLPEVVVRHVDWTTLRLCPGSFVDDELREQQEAEAPATERFPPRAPGFDMAEALARSRVEVASARVRAADNLEI